MWASAGARHTLTHANPNHMLSIYTSGVRAERCTSRQSTQNKLHNHKPASHPSECICNIDLWFYLLVCWLAVSSVHFNFLLKLLLTFLFFIFSSFPLDVEEDRNGGWVIWHAYIDNLYACIESFLLHPHHHPIPTPFSHPLPLNTSESADTSVSSDATHCWSGYDSFWEPTQKSTWHCSPQSNSLSTTGILAAQSHLYVEAEMACE